MTKTYSRLTDNDGCCESCDATKHYDVSLSKTTYERLKLEAVRKNVTIRTLVEGIVTNNLDHLDWWRIEAAKK
jgi:hypothetical protein